MGEHVDKSLCCRDKFMERFARIPFGGKEIRTLDLDRAELVTLAAACDADPYSHDFRIGWWTAIATLADIFAEIEHDDVEDKFHMARTATLVHQSLGEWDIISELRRERL